MPTVGEHRTTKSQNVEGQVRSSVAHVCDVIDCGTAGVPNYLLALGSTIRVSDRAMQPGSATTSLATIRNCLMDFETSACTKALLEV